MGSIALQMVHAQHNFHNGHVLRAAAKFIYTQDAAGTNGSFLIKSNQFIPINLCSLTLGGCDERGKGGWTGHLSFHCLCYYLGPPSSSDAGMFCKVPTATLLPLFEALFHTLKPEDVFHRLTAADVFHTLKAGDVFHTLKAGDVFHMLTAGDMFHKLFCVCLFVCVCVCECVCVCVGGWGCLCVCPS